MKRLLILAFLLFVPALVGQTAYYVDPNYTGGSNNGTQAHPYTSLSAVTGAMNTALASGVTTVYFNACNATCTAPVIITGSQTLTRTDTGTNLLTLDLASFYNPHSPAGGTWAANTSLPVGGLQPCAGFRCAALQLAGVYMFQIGATPTPGTTCKSSPSIPNCGGASYPFESASDNGTNTNLYGYIKIHGGRFFRYEGQTMDLTYIHDLTLEYVEAAGVGNVTGTLGPGVNFGPGDNDDCYNSSTSHWGCDNITAQYNYIHDTYEDLIYDGATTPNPPGGSLACGTNCPTGDSHLIQYNTIESSASSGGTENVGINIKDGHTNLRVIGNTIQPLLNETIPGGANCTTFACGPGINAESGGLFESNFINTPVTQGIAFHTGWDNSAGRSSITVTNNAFVGATSNLGDNSGIHFWNDGGGQYFGAAGIYNDSFYNDNVAYGGACIGKDSGAVTGTVTVENNIISTCGTGAISGTTTHDNNNSYNTGASCPGETHGVCSNPLYVSTSTPYVDTNFKLQSGSPSIAAGLNLYSSVPSTDTDYFGTARPTSAAYDQGFEQTTTVTQAAAPTFSPPAGTYTGTQTVAITSSTSGAIICWNTTGSPATNGSGTACTTGTSLSNGGTISVAANETVYAVAGTASLTDSTVASAVYAIQAVAPSCSPGSGTYTGTQSVACTNPNSGTTALCYATGSTIPVSNGAGTNCTTGTKYTTALSVSSSETLNVIAGVNGLTDSSVSTYVYTIVSSAVAPVLSPGTGSYPNVQTVTIKSATSGAQICYGTVASPAPQTNGAGTGCAHGTALSNGGTVTVSSTETLYAVAGTASLADSSVTSATYTIGMTANSFGFQCGVNSTGCPNLGSTFQYPTVVGTPAVQRLWGSSVQWSVLQPKGSCSGSSCTPQQPNGSACSSPTSGSSNCYAWTNIDKWMDTWAALSTPPVVIYTFGLAPYWVVPTSPTYCATGPGSGTGSGCPPLDLTSAGSQTFTNFVTALMNHCDAVNPTHCVATYIKYFELWNEPNPTSASSPVAADYWTGTVLQLYQMVSPAVSAIIAAEPSALILSPPTTANQNYTSWNCSWLAQEAGSGFLSNIYSFHAYLNNATPETKITTALLQAAPNLTYASTCGGSGWVSLPMWVTETNYANSSIIANPYTCSLTLFTVADCLGQMWRWQALVASNSIFNLDWYAWLIAIGSQSTYAQSYYNMQQTMQGMTFTAPASVSGSVWTAPLKQANGNTAEFVWTPNEANASYTVPAGYTGYQDINGGTHSVSGGDNLTVTVEPYLLTTTQALALPVCSPPGMTIYLSASVSCTGPVGATLCYRTDGTAPTAPTAGICGTGSTTYSGPITVNSSETIQMLATESGDINSLVTNFAYTVVSTLPSNRMVLQ